MQIINNKPGNSISCDQWLHILDELNIGAFTVDIQRRVSSMNYSAQTLIGLKDTEAIGRIAGKYLSVSPAWQNARLENPAIQAQKNRSFSSRTKMKPHTWLPVWPPPFMDPTIGPSAV